MDIAQLAEQQHVLHVAVEVIGVATIHIHQINRIRRHRTPHQVVVEAAAEAAVAQEVQSLAGHEQALQSITRQQKSQLLHQSAIQLKI